MNTPYYALLLSIMLISNSLAWSASNAPAHQGIRFEPVPSKALLQQRALFKKARQALNARKWSDYKNLKKSLRNYPLFHYLEYWSLRQNKAKDRKTRIPAFLARYPDTLAAQKLRSYWLKQLAKQGKWSIFRRYYQKGQGVSLQCQYLRSLLAVGKKKQVWAQMPALWLVAKSQPAACDPVFKAWRKAGGLSKSLMWQRIALAMAAGNSGLSQYIEKLLPAKDRPWVSLWRQIYKKPQTLLTAKRLAKAHPYRATMLDQGLRRMARKDPILAFNSWKKIAKKYSFSASQRQRIEGEISMRLIYKEPVGLLRYLSQLPAAAQDASAGPWRIRTALRQQNWTTSLAWIKALPKERRDKERWIYWQARALEALGKDKSARSHYQSIALERTFYGFLSADHLGQPYCMFNQPVTSTAKQYQKIRQFPGIQRAGEFYHLGDLTNARREWRHTVKRLSQTEQQIAAKIAESWQWLDQAIFSLARTDYWDDLDLRFPLAHRPLVTRHAKRGRLDTAWVYAIIRQESAFVSDARSRVGARGLMQLMPATARRMAKETGTSLRGKQQLFSPNLNIRLGTAYQRKMLNELGNRIVLATAAYNAGPSNVRKWLPTERALPADIWVETIPFKETRGYVRRVLSYTAFYQYRLGKKPKTLSSYLQPIVGSSQ